MECHSRPIQNGIPSIDSIPTEIWCQIFSNISHFPDIRNILLTCRKFRICLEEHHVLWKQGILVKNGLMGMASVNYPIGPSFSSMNDVMVPKKGVTEENVEEILFRHVHHRNRNSNLTLQYYAREVLVYSRRQKLHSKWECLVSQEENKISFLECAMVISQWLQIDQRELPTISDIQNEMNEISNRVQTVLDQELLRESNEGRVITNQEIRVKIILSSINKVFFDELKFEGSDQFLDDFDVAKILKNRKGLPQLLCVIYREISKKFKVNCDIISIGGDVYLGCKQIAEVYILINVGYNHGDMHQILQFGEFFIEPDHPSYFFDVLTINMVELSRILCRRSQITRFSPANRLSDLIFFSRLTCTVATDKTNAVYNYGSLCFEYGVQLEEALLLLQKHALSEHALIAKCKFKLEEQKTDLANLQIVNIRNRIPAFQIGDVVIYNKGHTSLVCVVIGHRIYSQRCEVLIDNGNTTVIFENLLTLHPTGQMILHPKIGVYFDHFDGRRYIANKETEMFHPNCN